MKLLSLTLSLNKLALFKKEQIVGKGIYDQLLTNKDILDNILKGVFKSEYWISVVKQKDGFSQWWGSSVLTDFAAFDLQ